MAITAVGDTLSVAASGSTDIQPASGETWLVTTILPRIGDMSATGTGDPQMAQIALADAGGSTSQRYGGWGSTTNAAPSTQERIVLTNSQYMRLYNRSTDTAVQMGYRGVKL